MIVLTRGEAFAKLCEARTLLRQADADRRRGDQKLASVRALVLEVHESMAWQQIEDPETCKRDVKGNPVPGTGRPYRGFGKCAAAVLGTRKRYANRLLQAAQVERNLVAQVGTGYPLLSNDKLVLIGDLEPGDAAEVAIRLRSAPEVAGMTDDEFRDWVEMDEDDEEDIDYDSLTPEEKCDLINAAARKHGRRTRATARLGFVEYWRLAWRKLGKWTSALRGKSVPDEKRPEAEALAARVEDLRWAVEAMVGLEEESCSELGTRNWERGTHSVPHSEFPVPS